jgi:hypothetical protein
MAGRGACHYAGKGLSQIQPFCGEKTQASCDCLSKAEKPKLLPPAYDHPWRTYGKKRHGKAVLNTLSTE